MTKRKLLAIVVTGALTAPAAMAQTGSVQIYGRANLSFDNYSTSGATAGAAADLKSRYRVVDSASRIGVRGTENLGGGLQALFQIESGVNADTGGGNGQSGGANPNSGALGSRDSYVGLGGAWGSLRFGRQSYWWVNGAIIQTGANYVNTEVPFFSAVALGRMVGPTARTSNTVQYNSPTASGFNFSLNYTPNSEAAAANANADGRIWGATARYSGRFNAQVDYAQNQAASPVAGTRPEVNGVKALVGWPYQSGARVSLIWLRVKNQIGAAAAGTIPGPAAGFSAANDRLSQSGWGLSWEHTFGNIQALAQYGRLGNASGCGPVNGCANTSTNAYLIGARYLASKRTALYATYNKVSNGSNQTTDYVAGGVSSVPNAGFVSGLAAGTDPRIVAFGVIHNF